MKNDMWMWCDIKWNVFHINGCKVCIRWDIKWNVLHINVWKLCKIFGFLRF